MTLAERTQRLQTLLNKVSGSDGLESLSMPMPVGSGAGLESLELNPMLGTVNSAIEKLKTGAPLTPLEAFGLEAIVLPAKRPVVFVHNNVFDPLTMPDWTHLNTPEIHARLDPLLASIGRIELPCCPNIPYGGTGFVVGLNLLMTNRHVAKLFAEGVGSQITYHSGDAEVDFNREDGASENDHSFRLEISEVVLIHSFWDMALLRVANLTPSIVPLKLSITSPEELTDKDIAVVGYPAFDYRNDAAIQQQVFNGKYGVKRLQPGKARPIQRITSFENEVDAMTHDSSTLGGNSGSALIEVATGQVVGLHFAGEYLKANYAVPMCELARDARLIDAGLNFIASIPSNGNSPRDYAINIESGSDDLAGKDEPDNQGESGISVPIVMPITSGGTTVTVTIPIQLAISIGTATTAGPAPSQITPCSADNGVEKVPLIYPNMSARAGYQIDFLQLAGGLTVPLPQLTRAGEAVASRLDDGTPVLNYHHYSLVLHKQRRLALFTAANVDWRPEMRKLKGRKPTRKQLNGFENNEREDWITDPRVPLDHQLPDYFYTKDDGAFDKGHLVRRDDVAWGTTFNDMQKGNGDTYHTTNCSPQTAQFNRAKPRDFNWGALENLIQMETKTEKVCVFSGPVLDQTDRYFHGLLKGRTPVSIQIPARFWKIIVASADGQPQAFGFLLDQDLSAVELHTELAVPQAWRKLMCPLTQIQLLLHGLATLEPLLDWDQHKRM